MKIVHRTRAMPSYVRAGIRKCARIRALSLLGLEDSVFISIVCFANRTKFKVKTHFDREFVVHTNDLKSAVLDHPQCMGLDMNAVADRLESLNIIDKAVRHEHIRDLQNTYSGKL